MRTRLPPLLLALAALAGEIEVPAGTRGAFPAFVPESATKEKPCPLVVACHGHGDTAESFRAQLKALADGWGMAILCPEGTEKIPNAGWGWGNANLPERGKAIETATREMLKAHPEVDARRIAWLGHSAGTWVCCIDGASRPELCKGIVLTAAPTAALQFPPLRKGEPRARVALFLGTQDFNYPGLQDRRRELQAAKTSFSLNQVTDLGHFLPDAAYMAGALHWVLDGEGPSEENTLPIKPSLASDRDCHHLLVRHKGALGAGPEVKRSADQARKEAERLAELLRKDKTSEKRRERARKSSEDASTREAGGSLGDEAEDAIGPLLAWACWSVPAGEVRVIRSPAGFHCVWAER